MLMLGDSMYGKVDQVPGLFHVATRFFHLQYVPLVPMGTYLILESGQTRNARFRIGLSIKSVLLAWLRAALWIAVIGCPFIGLVALAEQPRPGGRARPRDPWPAVAILAGFEVATAAVLWLSYRFTHSSPVRALDLAGQVGIPPEAVAAAFVHRLRPKDEEALARKAQDAQVRLPLDSH
jgi:hypothetical protein